MSTTRLIFAVFVLLAFGCGDSSGGGDDAAIDVPDGGDDATVAVCTPGAKRCAATVPETCAADGSGWEAGAACEANCTAGECDGPCMTGVSRCEGKQPQLCNAGGVFEATGAECPAACDTGMCVDACVMGTTRCAGNTVQTCDATGTFAVTATCALACDDGACVCGADYEFDGEGCVPRDFCDPSYGGCGPNATCTQTGVMPFCMCNQGYDDTGVSGLSCIDWSLSTTTLTEGFDDIDALATSGWLVENVSAPVGETSWHQGEATRFGAHAGEPDAYIAADLGSVAETGTIDNWLITPELDFGAAAHLSFFTRKMSPDAYPDRLEVRLCATLPCDVASVSSFDTLLIEINPDLTTDVYPTTWTQFHVVNVHGIPLRGRGRIAFRYFVTGAGPANGEYIGIDTVTYDVGAPSNAVSGVVGFTGGDASITLSLNRMVPVWVSSSGAFTFPETLSPGTPYVITVQDVPAGTTCEVTNGTGVMGTAAVTNVSVSCVTE